jgi:protein gp37
VKQITMMHRWVVEIRRLCRTTGVPFFFKQWGGVNKKIAGRELDGRTYDEMPETTCISCGRRPLPVLNND